MKGRPSSRPEPAGTGHARREPRRHGNPFVEKRNRRRQFAQVRAMAHVRVPLSSIFARTGACTGCHRGCALRSASWYWLVSVGLHVAFVVTAFGISRLSHQKSVARQQVAIEVREAKPKSRPAAAQGAGARSEARACGAAAPGAAAQSGGTAQGAAQGAARAVVGLSFESTVGEGAGEGEGPAFGVGNTRMGETAKTAAPAKEVPSRPSTMARPQ